MSPEERFELALEKVLADQSPRDEVAGLSEEEQRMLRMAELLRGSAGQEPDPDFVERLHDRLIPPPIRISRRTAFISGIGTLAAGLIGGIGLDHLANGSPSKPKWEPLVSEKNGRWIPVATVAEVPDGAVKAFTAGAVQGFLINKGGNLRALSRVCTHMGCTLTFKQKEQAFGCPCHGAEFNMHGRVNYGPKGYGQPLPPLPDVQVRVNGESVEVWGA